MGPDIEVWGIPGLPVIRRGDDVGHLICQALDRVGMPLKEGDVVVVAQSVISRSEGNVVRLEDVVPSQEAMDCAAVTGKDPRVVQVVLDESRAIVMIAAGFMICEARNGLVCANAGVDASNNEAGFVSKLPKDPDASARAISDALKSRRGLEVPVIISDTEGRPFRRGAIGVAVGVHGIKPVSSLRGRPDLFGKLLETTEVSVADMICSAAALVMGEAAEAIPAVVVRGAGFQRGGCAEELLYELDVFKSKMLEMGRHQDDNADD